MEQLCGETLAVAQACQPILGFLPALHAVAIDSLAATITEIAEQGATEVFVLPAVLDLNLLQRERIGQTLAEARRNHPQIALHHDDVDPGHPLLVQALADQVSRAIPAETRSLQHIGLILAASGHGDASSRANSYRLMRLVWEQLGLAAGEIGFVRHAQPFLMHTLEKCAQRPLNWVVLAEAQWKTEHVEFAAVILENFQRQHPEAASWRMAEPPGDHPAITAWLVQRITRLWNEKRARESVRVASPKRTVASAEFRAVGGGLIARVSDRQQMSCLLERVLPA